MEFNWNKKRVETAFGKETYLIGVESDDTFLWLEAPSWDCDWYWGFGYIETYTSNKSPQRSSDINSHSHVDSSGLDNMVQTVMTKNQYNEFNTLFEDFYRLKAEAGKEYTGGLEFDKQSERYKYINRQLLPTLFDEILRLVKPKK